MSEHEPIDMSWSQFAACRNEDPELFFSENATPESQAQRRHALRICETCSVTEPCLNYGLIYERFGIWGGTTAEQRNHMRRELKISARLDRFNLTTSITGQASVAAKDRKINNALAQQQNRQ